MKSFLKTMCVILFQIFACGFIGAVLGGVILYLIENNNLLFSAIGYVAMIIVVAILALIMYAERQMKNAGIYAILEG